MSTILTTSTPATAGTSRRAPSLVPYGLVLALGAVLGFAFLGRSSLFLDETVSTTLARAPWHRFGQVVLHRESNGALYFFVLRGWYALGHGEVALRSLSVIVTVGAVALVMKVAHDLFGRRVALLSGLLLAVDPLVVQYAQDARGYALSLLLVSASSALFVQGCRRAPGGWGTWAAYALVSAAGAYVNFWAVLVPVAHVASLGFTPPGAAPWRRVVPAVAAMVVLLVPLAVLIHANNAAGVNWASGTTAGKVFTKVRASVPHAVIDAAAVVGVLAAVALVVAGRRRGRPGWLFDRWPLMLAVCWFVVPVALVLVVSFAYMPLFVVRYLIVCAPGLVIVVGVGLARLTRGARVALVAVLVVGSAAGVARWYHAGSGQDWRGAVAALEGQVRAGDGAVVFPPYMRIPFEWYLDGHGALARALVPVYPTLGWELDPLRFDSNFAVSPAAVTRAAARHPRVWVVLSGADLYLSQEHDVVSGVEAAGLRPVRSEHFSGIDVIEYSRSGSSAR